MCGVDTERKCYKYKVDGVFLGVVKLLGTFVFSWKELLPGALNVLVEREVVEYNGLEISGADYKAQVIDSLCLIEWSASILTLMISMFM